MTEEYQLRELRSRITYRLPGWVTILAEYFGRYAERKWKALMPGKLEKELNKNEV